MTALAEQLADVTAGFSGVVSVSSREAVEFEQAYGFADRAHQVPNTVGTQFGLASGTKGFTALVIASLIDEGRLELSTPARSILGTDLPLIDDRVTVEHLLAHTSGIGDYVDEDQIEDDDAYVLTVPVHTLDETEHYLAALDGFPQKFAPGERFVYCNGGYVVLALLAERVSRTPFRQLVAERVWQPAGMHDSAFLRTDDLPGTAAIGYLADGRTNVLHLPVRGSGDGGAYSTVDDFRSFWAALCAGRIVGSERMVQMTAPYSDVPSEDARYGLGFWLAPTGSQLRLVGGDAGVAFWSSHDPTSGRTCTAVSNAGRGVAAIMRRLDALLPSTQYGEGRSVGDLGRA
jgi:CubicO group peptidase (beta-lactamase class C family)